MPYVTLRCEKCDNIDCPIANAYVAQGSQEGCTREVPEHEMEELQHQLTEVLPFLARRHRTDSTDAQFAQIESTLRRTYMSPLGHKLNALGKVDFRLAANKG